MSLSIVHLSDLHFRLASDKALNYTKLIVDACIERVRTTSQLVIAVTGDIAFSGQSEEYHVAETFFNALSCEFVARDCLAPLLIFAPGNHDCVLRPEDHIRSIVIDKVIDDPVAAENNDVINACVKPQENFFSFRDKVTSLQPVYTHPLWTEYEVPCEGHVVRFSVINAAWMSRLPEQQGQLVFPSALFVDVIKEPADLRIALLHHPLNWYSQASYHDLRTLLRSNCSAVLSGHEHTTAVGDISETGLGRHLYLEADALQPHGDGEKPGFSLALIDLGAKSAQVVQFEIKPPKALEISSYSESLRSLSHSAAEGAALTSQFIGQISDPGGAFIHPDKTNLVLDDVFVFPELRRLNGGGSNHRIEPLVPSDSFLLENTSGARSLILSEEKGGKTSLLYMLFKKLHSMGYWPLYFSASQMKAKTLNNLPQLINSLASEQYINPQSFLSASTHKRIALIDDLDRIKSAGKNLSQFLDQIALQFGGSIATASLGFQIEELIQPAANLANDPFHFFEIVKFGHRLRHKLIRKWCEMSAWSNQPELDRDVHSAEDLLNSVLGKNLAPALPIYLLILLQSWSQGQQGEIQNSSFARYTKLI